MTACPYEDGQLLTVNRGDYRGMILRVDLASSFWSAESYYGGNPKNGILNREGWQIVLEVQRGEKWLYIFREHENEVRRLTANN